MRTLCTILCLLVVLDASAAVQWRTNTVAPTGGDYTSVSAWEDALDGDLTLGNGTNYVCNIIGDWSATSDYTAVVLSGWTTALGTNIIIQTSGSARHSGKWTPSAHKIGIGNGDSFAVNEEFVICSGIQASNKATSTYKYAFKVTSISAGGSRIVFESCIARCGFPNQEGVSGFFSGDTDAWVAFINCTASECSGLYASGFWFNNATNFAYNCTSYTNAIGFNKNGVTVSMINCLAQQCTDGFFGTIATSTNNCSNIASDAPAPGRVTADVTFTDALNGDFHTSDSDVIDAGLDLSADVNYPFSTDIDGETRTGSWSIGADEYVVPVGGAAFIPRWLRGLRR
jgi:hypothetical protein